MQHNSKIYIAGHRGMVGSAIMRTLQKEGYHNILTQSHDELDLTIQPDVFEFFNEHKPEYVFLAAAKVGGIVANNTFRADFLYQNLMIQSNVMEAAHRYGVSKLLFLGSSCIYPKNAPQPLKEDYLLTGKLEPTNEPYAIAKIAGVKMCEAYHSQYQSRFFSVMPSNLYGIGDYYHPEYSHVLPALIRKFHDAKRQNNRQVVVWGTGEPLREFLYADDLADACLFLMNNYQGCELINVGVGKDITIKDLALLTQKITGYEGDLVFDSTKPDGTYRKVLDTTKINNMGWTYKTELEEGIKKAYDDFKTRYSEEVLK